MREIVLDTETTGLDPLAGHRIVEVGCLELVNMVATGITFHSYFNPERDMPTGAQDVHGLTEEFLSDKPLFSDKADELLTFLGDAQLVIHNAQFDLGFLNAELERSPIPMSTRCRWRGASFPASVPALTRCASVLESTTHIAPSMAPCSTRSSWLRSISS